MNVQFCLLFSLLPYEDALLAAGPHLVVIGGLGSVWVNHSVEMVVVEVVAVGD